MKYKRLFEKGQIGNLELKNRVVMSPMGTSLASSSGEASNEIIRYYEERAKGGTGLIITEITRIDDETGVGMMHQLSVTKPMYMKRLRYLADAVHKYDTKIFVQLQHPGRQTPSSLLNGHDIVAPSALTCPVIQEKPRALETEEVEELVQKFVKGAVIAKTAGIDGVEIHAAHGYLVNQFLSPHTNKRTDKYGGNFTNRVRFLTEIILGIRFACGPNFPISVRISADEYIEGGNTLNDTVKLARYLESLQIACLNVSCGTYESAATIIEPAQFSEGWKKHLSITIRENVDIPVIAVNTIKRPETAEKLLEEGAGDFIALGRGLLADPHWVKKAKENDSVNIRKCIGCLHCFKVGSQGVPFQCTVNPILGREYLFTDENLNKNGNREPVAIIGGGPAGMQSAKVLAQRNFKPVIFEKGSELGGTVILASKGAYKDLLGEFIETQKDEMKKLNVEIKLNTEATIEAVKAINPYGVVIARGGENIVPNLKGIDKDHVYSYEDILLENIQLKNMKIAVIGAGDTGLETAEFLANAGNDVSVIEMRSTYGDGLYKSVLALLQKRFTEKEIDVLTNKALIEIKNNGIVVRNTLNSHDSFMEVDAVVLAIGVYTDKSFNKKFEDSFDKVISVGDACQPGNIAKTLKEANDKSFVF